MLHRKPYIYQKEGWPNFTWDKNKLIEPLAQVRYAQGRLLGKMEAIGFETISKASLANLSLDALKSSEIEGVLLNPEEVRSSLARKLGLDVEGLPVADRNVEGLVEMMMDAVQNCNQPLSIDRLFDWHAALFPTGRSGMFRIIVGAWRDDSTGPMQVVSGAMGKEKVHFEAMPAAAVDKSMQHFIRWFNETNDLDPILKAGIAHFYFVTIHPFEDGNGRITRTLTDMLLARADDTSQRFYSMSAQIKEERKQYYEILERCQQGNLDITKWLLWFLNCLDAAYKASENTLAQILFKHDFWKHHAETVLNKRQVLMLNKILDGFDGNVTSSKWGKITKSSSDTALRDIRDLMKKNILEQASSGGRSTHYTIKPLPPLP